MWGAGEYLAQLLEQEYGFKVLHHTGEYDVEGRDYAYNNSLPALEKELYREDYSPASVEHFLAVCAGWLIGHTLTEAARSREKTAASGEVFYQAMN